MAWEKQKHIEEKTAQSIERLKADVAELVILLLIVFQK